MSSPLPTAPADRAVPATYVIGHRNPDADAICSAIAYAEFKRATGHAGYVAARCGNSNDRIEAILGRFGASLPEFVGDVTPRVEDIMNPGPLSVRPESTCAEALELLDRHDIRALPVVDADHRLVSHVSIFDLGDAFIPKPRQAKSMRRIRSSVAAIVRTLGGEPLTLSDPERVEDLFVRVAAMGLESFGVAAAAEGIAPGASVIVVGDRRDVQARAIEMGVRLIVITGGHGMDADLVAAARAKGVSVTRSTSDSATTAWAVRAAHLLSALPRREAPRFQPQEKLALVRRRIVQSNALLNCVTDEEGRLVGVFTKSDILRPVATRLVLVDHNELSQAVDGAAEVEITEVIDHHRLGNPPTHHPILFINRPLGSTCSIVADLFRSAGLRPSPQAAGLMMSGLISDTLHLQSPTATPLDAELLAWLAPIAGCEPRELADLIFSAGSILSSATPDAAVRTDCKLYEENGARFSVSQVEELGFTAFWKSADALLAALERHRAEHALLFSCLLVTDIDTQGSLLLVRGDADVTRAITYPLKRAPDIFDLPGIVSRKKQLLPFLTGLLAEGGAGR
jgi:manganese-dependent inorganic pyrophosphatase